jgi:hypothetical protein
MGPFVTFQVQKSNLSQITEYVFKILNRSFAFKFLLVSMRPRQWSLLKNWIYEQKNAEYYAGFKSVGVHVFFY